MIETSSVIAMALAGLVCTAFPILLLVIWRKKTGAPLLPFFVGAGTFILFALVLEQLLHRFFLLGNHAVSQTVRGSVVFYTLYGGFAAGIFEETGRFAAFKLMKKYDSRETAITYGIGHGGIEAFLIVGVNMLVSAVLALLLNQAIAVDTGIVSGDHGSILGSVDPLLVSSMQNITPISCLLATWERLVTVLFHIALSVLVFAAARRGKLWLYPVAIVIHACVDFIAVLYQQGIIKSLFLTEVAVTVYTAATIYFTLRVWRKLSTPPKGDAA